MKRRLFTIAAAISLLLCMATAVLWVRSYRRSDSIVALWLPSGVPETKSAPARAVSMITLPGRIRIGVYSRERIDVATHLSVTGRSSPPYWDAWLLPWYRRWFPFVSLTVDDSRAGSLLIEIPLWLPLLAGGPPVLLSIRSFLRARLIKSGGCTTCGYDLRATPNRCPECGTAAVTKAATP
jgi:hypothetical protein